MGLRGSFIFKQQESTHLLDLYLYPIQSLSRSLVLWYLRSSFLMTTSDEIFTRAFLLWKQLITLTGWLYCRGLKNLISLYVFLLCGASFVQNFSPLLSNTHLCFWGSFLSLWLTSFIHFNLVLTRQQIGSF